MITLTQSEWDATPDNQKKVIRKSSVILIIANGSMYWMPVRIVPDPVCQECAGPVS